MSETKDKSYNYSRYYDESIHKGKLTTAIEKYISSHPDITKVEEDSSYVYFLYSDGSTESIHKFGLLQL